MTYTSEILHWRSYEIEIRYATDPYNLGSRTDDPMSHVEVRTLKPENAPLPVTETGYKSHFTVQSNIMAYGGAVAFVKAWLDHEVKSVNWKIMEDNARQLSLF